jgi:hypothetical protein
MSRYNLTNQIKDVNGVRKSASLIFPVPPISANDTYITTTTPDRLDKLANDFYGDSQLWWIIASANGLGKGTLTVPANITIRIPVNSGIDELIQQINTQR